MSVSVRSKKSKRSSTTPTSILKKSNYKSRTNLPKESSKVRFILPHTKNVHNILQEYAKEKIARDYENLVCLIRDADLLDEDISSLLKEANECVSILDYRLQLFVEALLHVKWIHRHSGVIQEYQSFIVNLLSAHNYHSKMVLDKLVSLFIPDSSEPEWPDGKPTECDISKLNNIHTLLKQLLKVVPMCNKVLWNALHYQFPYFSKSVHIHECYIQNLLWILDYTPVLRPDILHLILSKLVIIDVNAPRDEIQKLQNEDEEMFFMEDDSKSVVTKSSTTNMNSIANKLDVCLDLMFNFIINECHDSDSGKLNWEKTKYLYHDMITVFDKVILPTHNIHHVQFVMFVMCNLKSTVAEAFLNFLWKKVCNPNIAPVLRQSAVAYMASVIARGKFVPEMMLKGTLQQMSEWIHSYISVQESVGNINSDVRIHAVFYSVCQALFYVVAFRHVELVSTKSNIVFLASLNMGKIVTCRLNPLRVCQPAVVQNFAAIARKYQLAYCYSVMEHNARNVMPTIYQDERGSMVVSDNVLETFFPFDPYILDRSGEKIQPIYRNVKNIDENTKMDVRETGEVDDFLEHQEISTTPKSSHKFSYGSSPGFKYKY